MTDHVDRIERANDGIAARLEAINGTIKRHAAPEPPELKTLLDRLTGKIATAPGERRPATLAQALEQAGLTKSGVSAPAGSGAGPEPARIRSGRKRPVGAGKRIAMTVRIDHDRYQALKSVAAAHNLSSQKLLQAALDAYLDRHGDR